MAKNKKAGCGCNDCECGRLREYYEYGIVITIFGCLWMAQSLGWVNVGVPLGPLVAIMIGMSLLLPWLKK